MTLSSVTTPFITPLEGNYSPSPLGEGQGGEAFGEGQGGEAEGLGVRLYPRNRLSVCAMTGTVSEKEQASLTA